MTLNLSRTHAVAQGHVKLLPHAAFRSGCTSILLKCMSPRAEEHLQMQCARA